MIHPRLPRLAVKGEPDLVRLLRREPVETQGRKQADNSFGNALAYLGQWMALADLSIGEHVKTPAHAGDDSLLHKPWSTHVVLKQTLANAIRGSLSLRLLPTLEDIDDVASLQRQSRFLSISQYRALSRESITDCRA